MPKEHELPGYDKRVAIEQAHRQAIIDGLLAVSGIRQAIKQAIENGATGKEHAEAVAAHAVNQNVTYDATKLEGAIRSASEDAVKAGAERAAEDTATDAVISGARINTLMNSLRTGADQILRNSLEKTRNAISDGLLIGKSEGEIYADVMNAIASDSRADTIALTKVNDAESTAYFDQIAQAGYSQWEWLTYEGACEICEDKAGVHDISDTDTPPGHPRCRCAVVLPETANN